MLSQEFISAVRSGNLLRVRIMLKDSLVIDPTFKQFNEMFNYARQTMAQLLVLYDGGALENDRSRWNKDVMNTELIEIVNNFSQERIDHVKQVVRVALKDDIRRANTAPPAQPSAYGGGYPSTSSEQIKAEMRRQALNRLTSGGREVSVIMNVVAQKRSWSSDDIQKMKNAANKILAAVRDYENNR